MRLSIESGEGDLITSTSASGVSIASLCPACGLCCNGVLFGDVELQKTDHPKRFTALGLELQRKGKKLAFSQPCSCFDGSRCRIYPKRPTRCRTFECRVLKRLDSGDLSADAALKLIETTRRQADRVRDLLRQLGCHDEQLPLNRRYTQVMAQPIDLAAEDATVEQRAQLMLEVDQLMKTLHQQFLV